MRQCDAVCWFIAFEICYLCEPTGASSNSLGHMHGWSMLLAAICAELYGMLAPGAQEIAILIIGSDALKNLPQHVSA